VGLHTKSHKIGTIKEYIVAFDSFEIKTKHLANEIFNKLFISGFKEQIKSHIEMNHPATLLEASQLACLA
jgi:hypothetical protein